MEKTDNNKFLNIAAGLFLAGFSVYVLKELSSIFIPFVLAIIISFVFEPFYSWMLSKKIPSFLAVIIVLISLIVITNIASVFIIASINSFSSDFSVYEKKFTDFFNSVILTLHISSEEMRNLNEFLKISNLLQQGSITNFIAGFFTSFLSIFGDFILILFYVIFLLSEMVNIKERIRKAFNKEKAESIITTLDRIFIDVRKYITGKTLISLILGTLSGFILWMFGVDFYFIWGFLIFLMHFIPSIGALIAISLPSMVMFLQFDNIYTPIFVTILLLVLQNVIGNIVEPKFMGDKLDLSPLLLLLSLFLGGYIWGIVGMVLSVPIVSMLKIILMNFESTRPIAILMSYRTSEIEKKILKRTSGK